MNRSQLFVLLIFITPCIMVHASDKNILDKKYTIIDRDKKITASDIGRNLIKESKEHLLAYVISNTNTVVSSMQSSINGRADVTPSLHTAKECSILLEMLQKIEINEETLSNLRNHQEKNNEKA